MTYFGRQAVPCCCCGCWESSVAKQVQSRELQDSSTEEDGSGSTKQSVKETSCYVPLGAIMHRPKSSEAPQTPSQLGRWIHHHLSTTLAFRSRRIHLLAFSRLLCLQNFPASPLNVRVLKFLFSIPTGDETNIGVRAIFFLVGGG